ncbi:MAG: hypothetical protein JWN44_6117 [Myxococcales bacterium]|nr:hypothetical protein [Myxococcales bacterium]
MSLQQLDANLWTLDFPLRVGGLALGGRSTVVRRGDGSVALISPGPLSDDDVAALAALGPVRALVAPNLMHHMHLAAARQHFLAAKLYAPAALARKQPTLTIDGPPEAVTGSDLHAIAIGGMPKLQETVFVHGPSRTLVVTDLVFNVRMPAPWFTRLFMRVNGGFDRFGPTRICRSLAKDRAAVRRSVDAVLTSDFDRVIVAHGRILESGGHAALRSGFDWLPVSAAGSTPAA